MSDFPDRDIAKVRVNVLVDCDSMQDVKMISTHLGASLSETIELVIFMVKGIYEQADGEQVIRSMLKLKAARLANISDLRHHPPSKRLHLSLDVDAHRFLVLLAERYPPVFSGRNEALCLCLAYVQQICDDAAQVDYLLRRLESVMQNHPKRRLKGKSTLR